MKFESYTDWLYEREILTPPKYGCVMLFADIPNWKKHLAVIDPNDIYDIPDHGMTRGLEQHPHVTIIYGLYLGNPYKTNADPSEIKKIMESFHPVKVNIKSRSVFNLKDCEVVKYDVPVKEELKEWRNQLLRFPNKQFFEKYKPHITISYVKHGTGKKYIKEFDESFGVIFNKAVYSYTNNKDNDIVVQLDEV